IGASSRTIRERSHATRRRGIEVHGVRHRVPLGHAAKAHSMTNVYTSPIPLPEPPRPRRRVGRILALSLFGLVAGILVIAVIAAGVGVWTIQRSFPQVSGTVALDGLGERVTVQRSSLGVPTIEARDTHDLFFAQGYV